MVRSNHNKIDKRLEKFIPQQQHHPHLDVAIRNPNSPCRHAKEVVDVITAVIIIFIEPSMERPNSPFILVVIGYKEEEPSPHYQKTWHGENET
jgi:hypothetical protein